MRQRFLVSFADNRTDGRLQPVVPRSRVASVSVTLSSQWVTHQEWMQRAIDLAVANVREGRGGPFGAVVVKDDKVIGSGTNLVTATNDPTAHAEVVAIRAACEKLRSFQLHGCVLYSNCEPCPMCLGAIYWARPVAYYFAGTRADAASAGFDDAMIYSQMRLTPEKRTIPGRRILAENGRAPFVAWARSVQKVNY